MNRSVTWGMVVVAGVLIVGTSITIAAAAISTWFACGAWPQNIALLDGIRTLGGQTPVMATSTGCRPTQGGAIAAAAVLFLVPAISAGLLYAWWLRWRQSDQYLVRDLRKRDGFAQRAEVQKQLSGKAVLRNAKQLRPDLAKPKPSDVGWPLGESRGVDVFVSIEDSVVLEGPPRSGKGFRVLIPAILDWSGPLITTSTTNDNLTATMRARQRRGEVSVFDPQGLSGIRHALRISPIAGCEDPLVATQKGAAIINGTALGASSTNAEWAQASSTVLARLLHAAAVGGRSVEQLYDWGSSPSWLARQWTSCASMALLAGATTSMRYLPGTRSSCPRLGSACRDRWLHSLFPRSVTRSCLGPAIPFSTRTSSYRVRTRST